MPENFANHQATAPTDVTLTSPKKAIGTQYYSHHVHV